MTTPTFQTLKLSPALLKSIDELGYETPTPIQMESIPLLLSNHDLLAQAQTGTGKTAAFALPILTQINLKKRSPQALVVAPTRELAIQIAEAFQSYAKHLPGFQVVPIYGGQDYRQQLKALDRGPHVLVATPGRLIDHLKRKSVDLNTIQTIILDEADEMLNMGFIEDIEWICKQAPEDCQKGFFSATMAKEMLRISKTYLNEPKKVKIEAVKQDKATIRQSYIEVDGKHKLDVLTRIMAVINSDGIIIFSRTKNGASELSDKLQARGYASAALHGDMSQDMREKVVARVKKRSIDCIVATDVAARGLDIDRLSHVINYDIPYDVEAYTHRIGRTGRAGKEGSAILLVTPRERRLLQALKKYAPGELIQENAPTVNEIKEKQEEKLVQKLQVNLGKTAHHDRCLTQAQSLCESLGCSAEALAAALLMEKKEKTPKELPPVSAEPSRNKSFKKHGDKRHSDKRHSDKPYGKKRHGEKSHGKGNFSGKRSEGNDRRKKARHFDK